MQRILLVILVACLTISSTFANITSEKPKTNIVLNALMKSGSEHIVTSLQHGLSYKRLNLYSTYEPIRHTYYSNITEFYQNESTIAKQHLKVPSVDISKPHPIIAENNIDTYEAWRELDIEHLKTFTNKMVLHIRDPRPALLSLVHHLNAFRDHINKPEGYFELSLHDRIDWCIDNMLASQVKWINDWLAYKEQQDISSNGMQILVTTYDELITDELITDELKLYHKILKFYDIPTSQFKFQPVAKNKVPHFRKGDPEEWRQVLTAEQQHRVALLVPDSLLNRFNWSK